MPAGSTLIDKQAVTHLCDMIMGRRVLMPMGETALWVKPLSSSETASGASRMLNHLHSRQPTTAMLSSGGLTSHL